MRIVSIALVLLFASAAQAVPLLLEQQGRLLSSSDQPVTGSQTVSFSLWDSVTAGNLVWTESHDVRNRDADGHAVDTWYDIPGRTITFTKARADSVLRIEHSDTLGYTGVAAYDACRWRILVDGSQVAWFSSAPDTQEMTGWRMMHGSHVALAAGQSAGSHTIKVQNLRHTAVECMQGWNQSGNFLSVQEVGP